MDWNWFFSSVAQSTAAIVGIFAAFTITKVIGNQTEFSKKRRLMDEMIAKSRTFKDEADIRKFEWFNGLIFEEEERKIENIFKSEGIILSPEEYYEKYNFSDFQSKDNLLELLRDIYSRFHDFKKQQELEQRDIQSELFQGQAFPTYKHRLMARHYYPNKELSDESDLINYLIVKINEHCRVIKNFINENSCNPESSTLVNISLCLTTVLFFSGVIYPLSFLPLKLDSEIHLSISAFWNIFSSVRGFILSVVSITFTFIIITFLNINSKLKYDKQKMQVLYNYSLLCEYSKYLKNMEENTTKNSIT